VTGQILRGEDEIVVAEGFLSKVVDSCGNYFKLIAKSVVAKDSAEQGEQRSDTGG
jgi:hypothetical protein